LKVIEELLNTLPDFVLRVLSDFKEESTESVWLVCSRANQTATPNSDWDLLVFSSIEPEVVSPRGQHVDVIRVGPSRQVLLEGQEIIFKHSFTVWQWREIDEVEATYVGKKFINDSLVAHDYNDPRYSKTEQLAYLLWAKHKTVS
jgi:Nucleotidyltransferase domain.